MNTLKQLFKGRDSAADAAKQRLRFVLIHDRAEIPPGMLDLIKDDIIAVISHRVPIDRAHVSVSVDNAGNENRLLVDIPLMADERKKGDGAGSKRR
jgi:cell division topological specificity factor